MPTIRYTGDGVYEVQDSTGHIGEIVKMLHPRPSGRCWVAYDQNTYQYGSVAYSTLAKAVAHFDRRRSA